LQDGSNGLEGVDAAPCGGADDRPRCGVEVCAPFGSETAGDLAVGGCGAEFALAAVVVRGDVGMVEAGEEVLAELAVALSQSQPMAVVSGP